MAKGAMGWRADLHTVAAFLTIIPLGKGPGYRPGGLMAASWCFPIVGLLIGLGGGLIYAAAVWLGFTVWLAAILSVGALVLLTGGLHEDGLGDFVDGLGGTTRDRRLEIMHDSQAGNFAIIALVLLFAARIGAVAALETPDRVIAAVIAVAAISRTAIVVVMYLLPAARRDGLSAGAGRPGGVVTLIAIAVAAVVSVVALGVTQAITSIAAAAIVGGLI
ncbi:MAG: adenosylcobinamide-GDP ribazoletransferase, partial [Rhodospirillaceae bacterium]|nr:adenosylcobinamide-GDP ribazoletransferase [Rhodospirillaceae bacterium]